LFPSKSTGTVLLASVKPDFHPSAGDARGRVSRKISLCK